MSNSNISENIVRIQANQVGPFTATNNIIDINIPGGQVIDMTRSYVEIELRSSYAHTGAQAGISINGTYNPVVNTTEAGDGIAYDVQMIRNCRLQSQNQGHLEEINRVDVLRTGLNNLTMSRDEQTSLNHLGVAQVRNNGNQRYGPFIDAVSEGDIKSTQKVPRAKIPLKQLFGLGEVSQLDLSKTGDLNIRLELNIPTVAFDATNYNGNVDANPVDSVGQVTAAQIVQATNNKDVVLTNKYENLHNLPFWVNQYIKLSGDTGTFVAGTGQYQVIKSIAHDPLTGTVTLTLPNDILNAGQTLANTNVEPEFTGVAPSVSVENVSLVYTSLQGANPSGQNAYMTFDTEQLSNNVTGQKEYSQIFTLPPNCINYITMFPNSNLISNLGTDGFSYRNRLDDKQETFRKVDIDSPFYFEQLRRTLINGGMRLRVLGKVVDATEKLPASVNAGKRQNYVMNAVPQTANSKLLQMNISSETVDQGPQKINLYKQLVKML